MKTPIYGFLAASILGLACTPAFADEAARIQAAVYTPNVTPHVEVVALNSEQAARLLSERQKHLEELAKLNEEHKRAVEAILASTSRLATTSR